MSAASGIGLAMPSGLDDDTIINELVAVQQQNVTTVQNQVTADQASISAYGQIQSLLGTINTAAAAVSTSGSFDVFSSSSSNSDAVGISGGSGSVAGQYDVSVYNLASSEKMISADGKISSNTASLSSQGIGVGTISVDGVNISVSSTDTIQDLCNNINAATQSDGTPINVNASVVQVGTNDYRLLLSDTNTGSDGIAYEDVSGTTLQDLGIITDAAGDKGNLNQTLQSSDDIATDWNNLATGSAVQITGTDHDGNAVSSTFTKNSGETLSDFLSKITSAYNGTATATTDASGHLVLTDAITGTSDLAMSTLSLGGTNQTMTVTQGGENGAGVLSAGSNAYYNIDGMQMNSDTNSVTSFQAGTTFSLNAVSATPVTVGLTLNTSTIEQNVEAVLNGYNSLLDYVNSATQVGTSSDPSETDDTTATTQGGPLAGDMTATSIASQIDSLFEADYGYLGGNLTSLAMIGIQTDPNTGHLSLDESTFESAMQNNPTAVENLFTQVGTSNNPSVAFGQSTSTTQSGAYTLKEVDPDHVAIELNGTNQWYTSDARNGDVVTFSNGPASGLSITAPAGSVGSSTTFTYSSGLAGNLTNTISNMTDPSSGLIQLQTTTLQTKINDENTQIATLTDQCNQYRTRLVQEFSTMESMMNNLHSQSSSITSSFGTAATA
jgi:flagellar hook-associated protein 2